MVTPVNLISPQQFEFLLPLAQAWAERQEALILKNGVPLSAAQMADARRIGIAFPERVRLLRVPQIPQPEHPLLRAAGEQIGLITSQAAGLTLRYGIYICAHSWDDRHLVVHEMAHVRQYEKLGGFAPFLRQYLTECLTVGYHDSPLEQDAIATAQRICDT